MRQRPAGAPCLAGISAAAAAAAEQPLLWVAGPHPISQLRVRPADRRRGGALGSWPGGGGGGGRALEDDVDIEEAHAVAEAASVDAAARCERAVPLLLEPPSGIAPSGIAPAAVRCSRVIHMKQYICVDAHECVRVHPHAPWLRWGSMVPSWRARRGWADV